MISVLTGCRSDKILENGCRRSSPNLYPYAQSLMLFRIGQTEQEVAEIMKCPPVSRYYNPKTGISECFWFYAKTQTDKMGIVQYNGQVNCFKFRDGKLIGVKLNNPNYMFGDTKDDDPDALWFYTKNASAKAWSQYNRLVGMKFFYNDKEQCYVHDKNTRVVDYWDGTTCHWKIGKCKVGYYRFHSPDNVYFIDVPNDKNCEYIGNGRFRMYPKNAPAAAGNNDNPFGDLIGEMAGAFLEGAVQGAIDGLAQGAVDSALRKKNKKRNFQPSYSGGGGGNRSSNKSSVRPSVPHSSCRGSGICPICRGRKIVGADITCTGCGGSGRCRACGGRGYVN